VRRLFLLLLLALLLPAQAATNQSEKPYQIEVLVFEHHGAAPIDEQWPTGVPAEIKSAIEPNGNLPAGAKLASAVESLEKDKRYRVLAYAGWTQVPTAKSQTKPIRISGSEARPGELDGAVTFHVSRFLHLDVNLRLRETGATDGDPVVYRIRESRRVKSQETQYFDHPRFGLLVRITPLGKG
jgi:hypothetical protein